MANIDLDGVYRQMQREFATQGTADDRFELDFINAVNDSIARINVGADLTSKISMVENTEEVLASLDNNHRPMLTEGVRMALALAGRRPAKQAERFLIGSDARFTNLIMAYYADLKNNIDSDDEDEICLGSLD